MQIEIQLPLHSKPKQETHMSCLICLSTVRKKQGIVQFHVKMGPYFSCIGRASFHT